MRDIFPRCRRDASPSRFDSSRIAAADAHAPPVSADAPERLDQVVAETNRMRRSETKPLAGHRSSCTASSNCTKGLLPSPFGNSCRPYRFTIWPRSVTSFTPLPNEFTHFAHNLVDRAAALRAARLRHDAESAMHVAALHDRNESRRLARRDLVLADRFLRTGFLFDVDDREARIVHPRESPLLRATTSST